MPHPKDRLPHLARLSHVLLFVVAATASIPLLAGSNPPNQSAAQPTGTVTGRVQNPISGRYLINAKVSVQGTGLYTLTDETGSYLLVNVPAGQIVVEVFYTGLDKQQISLTLGAGQSVEQDVSMTSGAEDGAQQKIVTLNSFVVAASRETDARAIAINEQRFASNIKNVVTSDAYGDIIGGNIGDFLKYIPGVFSADNGSAPEPSAVSLRGFGSSFTGFSIDGAKVANAGGLAPASRSFDLNQSSIASIARVEVTKVPTPSDPADSIAGVINLVSKSAFERSRAELRYRLGATSNSEWFSLVKTTDTLEKRTYKIFPGFEFDYTLPINKNFGMVATALHSRVFYPGETAIRSYSAAGVGTGASFAAPFYNQEDVRHAVTYATRDSVSLKADWRITPHGVLSAGLTSTYYVADIGFYDFLVTAGTTGTPTILSGTNLSYGPDYTNGATGRGSAVQSNTFRHWSSTGTTGSLNYRFNDGNWKVDSGVSRSYSRNWLRDTAAGFFAIVSVTNVVPERVTFSGINSLGPTATRVFDNNNNELSVYDASNYKITAATTRPSETRDEVGSQQLSVRRTLRFLPFPASLKIGGLYQTQARDVETRPASYTYNPPGGDLSIAPYVAPQAATPPLYYLFTARSLPWISPIQTYQAWQRNPALFTQTPAQVVATVKANLNGATHVRETTTAIYLQADGSLLNNRLNVVTGVRFEKVGDEGSGPIQDPGAVFVRNANGTFARDAAGQQIRKPEAGAVGSLQELALTDIRQGRHVQRAYSGYYPSLLFRYHFSEALLARTAYAKTYGRPDFSNIVPIVTVAQSNVDPLANPDAAKGTITLANTGLKPWSANNYDLSLEYYTKQGGVFSVGAFVKQIDDFFGTVTKVAAAADLAALGLDPSYEGWQVTTRFNSGSARVSGVEFNASQTLAGLGGWGQYFTAFMNGTKLKLSGGQGNFLGFIPESWNCGMTYKRKPLTIGARVTRRGKYQAAAVAGLATNSYHYAYDIHPRLDLNADYSLGARTLLYGSVKNVTHVPVAAKRYGDETPNYAKTYLTGESGIIFEVGIKGTF